MKIVVLGLGETGYYLAQLLLKQGHDLVLIERDPKKVALAQEDLDAQIVMGSGSDALVLEPLVDEDVDFFIAVTDNDEVNIVATMIARKFGVQRGIVRVCKTSNLIHPLLTDDPKVSVLNAEITAAKDVVRLVGNPSADEIDFFANDKVEMMKLDVSEESQVAHKALRDIHVPKSWIFVAILRKGEFQIASGDSVIEPGDHVLVIGDPKKSDEIEKLLGLQSIEVRRVIIVGTNDISYKLAHSLVRRGIDVRIIEENKELAEKASGDIDGALVLNGDGTNEELLNQAGIDQCDYVLALTEDDENNVLISLLAKEKNVRRVVVLTQKRQYKHIVEKIGIDSVINPRSAMVDEILRYVHGKELTDINILEGGKGQMIEFTIEKKTKAVGVPLSKLKLPKQSLVGAIVRKDNLIIPRGGDKIKIGDRIIIFTTQSVLSDVKRMFAG